MSLPPLTKDDLLRIWRSVVDKNYGLALETQAQGQGFDGVSAGAKIFERAAAGANTTFESYYLLPASTETAPPSSGAAFAIGTVTLTRAAPAAQDIVLSGGLVKMVADVTGPDGVLQDGILVSLAGDVTFAAGDTTPQVVPVIADRVGPQGDLVAGSLMRFKELGRFSVPNPVVSIGNLVTDSSVPDRFTPTVLGRLVKLVGGANDGVIRRAIAATTGSVVLEGAALVVGAATTALVLEVEDVGITVSQPVALSGGLHGELDAIGEERLIGRQPGEIDDLYRTRLARLPDVVSPAAILRIASRVLTPLGVPFKLLEIGADGTDSTSYGFYLDTNFLDAGSFANGDVLTLSASRQFALVIGWSDVGNPGIYLDRGFLDVGYLDGFSAAFFAAVSVLIQLVNAARAAGVRWSLLVDPSL